MSTAPDSEAKVLTKEVAFLLVSCVALSAFFFGGIWWFIFRSFFFISKQEKVRYENSLPGDHAGLKTYTVDFMMKHLQFQDKVRVSGAPHTYILHALTRSLILHHFSRLSSDMIFPVIRKRY